MTETPWEREQRENPGTPIETSTNDMSEQADAALAYDQTPVADLSDPDEAQ
jgi:hypothetical protein